MKTGEYATIWEDSISEQEKGLISKIGSDPLLLLDEEIKLLTIRESRMLRLRDELLEQRDALNSGRGGVSDLIRDTHMTVSDIAGEQGKQLATIQHLTEKILAIEDALTRVQEKKLRAIDAKHRIMKELNRYTQNTLQMDLMKPLTNEELMNLARLADEKEE